MNVHFALIALLAGGPRSGLSLRQELVAGPSSMPPPNARRVDLALTRLERAGLVESAGAAGTADPRPEFRITADGQRELAGWLRTTPAPGALPGDELVLKIQLAGQVPGTDVREVIQVHRRYLIELMQRRTRARHEAPGQDLGRALASSAELFRLESAIRWLDAAEGLLAGGAAGAIRRGVGGGVGADAGRAAGKPPADQIRASDADREQAAASLRDHFAEGRLTRVELDERLTTALCARTAGDLRRLMADLP